MAKAAVLGGEVIRRLKGQQRYVHALTSTVGSRLGKGALIEVEVTVGVGVHRWVTSSGIYAGVKRRGMIDVGNIIYVRSELVKRVLTQSR